MAGDVAGLGRPDVGPLVHHRAPPVLVRVAPGLGAGRRAPVRLDRGEDLVRLVGRRHQNTVAVALRTIDTANDAELNVPLVIART